MKLNSHFPPHIRSGESNFTMMLDAIAVTVPLYFLSLFYYGARSILLMLLSVFVCWVCDISCRLAAGRKITTADLSPVVTGMLIPLMLPASIDFKIVALAGIFAIVVVKQPFGGAGQNMFNPAAAGIAFVCVSFPEKVFSYPMPLDKPELWTGAVTKLVNSPLARLRMNTPPSGAFLDTMLGNFPGPMGTTHILVLLSCLLFLCVRKTASFKTTITFLGTCALFAFIFPRIPGERLDSVFYELVGGSLLFGSIFLLSDPVTSPKRDASKIICAAVTAVVTMLFRYFGGYEEEIFFAILLVNSSVWLIDIRLENYISERRHSRLEERSEKSNKSSKPA